MEIEELKKQIESNNAVMVYFSGIDCGVCEVLKPKVKELFEKEFPKVKQLYINANQHQKSAAQFCVLTIPTVIVFFDKKEFIRQSRHISIADLKSQIQRPYDLFFN